MIYLLSDCASFKVIETTDEDVTVKLATWVKLLKPWETSAKVVLGDEGFTEPVTIVDPVNIERIVTASLFDGSYLVISRILLIIASKFERIVSWFYLKTNLN